MKKYLIKKITFTFSPLKCFKTGLFAWLSVGMIKSNSEMWTLRSQLQRGVKQLHRGFLGGSIVSLSDKSHSEGTGSEVWKNHLSCAWGSSVMGNKEPVNSSFKGWIPPPALPSSLVQQISKHEEQRCFQNTFIILPRQRASDDSANTEGHSCSISNLSEKQKVALIQKHL